MCLFFVFGEQKYRRSLAGYDNLRVRCYNCGNWNAHVIKTHPFITLCWIPVIPLSFKGEVDVHCNTCGWDQAIEQRQDVQAQRGSGGQGQAQAPVPGQGPVPGQDVPLQDQGQGHAKPQGAGPARYA
jgi:ribosomal protein S27E